MSNQKSVDRSKQCTPSVGQMELPLLVLPAQIPDHDLASNVVAFRAKPPRPSNTGADALHRILAYAETLAP